MVQDATERRGIAEVVMQGQYPGAYAFLRRFARPLRTRSLYTKYFDDRDPFYSMYTPIL
jgi:hypothetical protein